MNQYLYLFFLIFFPGILHAQLAEVQANYNSVGDVDFIAYNNTPAPIYLNIDFADLENTTFNEPLPYIKMLEPGFNTLFTLFREPDADVPRFNYQIKIFKSNPWALADLEFPYLIPFAPGEEISVAEVKSIAGFLDSDEPESWNTTGFAAKPGQKIFAARTGTVVEITGSKRSGDPQAWYHAWNNSITVLQPDGTLICYRNITDNNKKLKVGERIFAGQQLGTIVPTADRLIVVIFQHSLNSSELRFIIPRFVYESQTGVLLSSRKYIAVHPDEIRGLEMSNREKRKQLR